MRVIKFPDFNQGELLYWAKQADEEGWESFGEAKGEVSVPDDAILYLVVRPIDGEIINFEPSLEYLNNLEPDDLYGLTCWGVTSDSFEYISRLNLRNLVIRILRDDITILQSLQKMKDLKALSLAFSRKVMAGVLANLEYLPPLESLDISETGLGDEDIARIAQLENLESLNMPGTPTTDKALGYLKNLEKLKFLNLGGNKVTNEGIVQLNGLNLKELYIGYTQLTGDFLSSLTELKNLTNLGLQSISNLELAGLKNFPALGYLDLSYTKIGDNDLDLLPGLPFLRILRIYYTQISLAGLQELKKKFPEASIESELETNSGTEQD